jgi:hypothetical protein
LAGFSLTLRILHGRRNINRQTVAEIWANPEYQRLQRKLWEGHRCTECALALADRTPIFGTKAAKSQIGYIENGGAFDLSGRRRCNYNAATGNLSDPVTEKLVGYVSLDGNFVVPSRIAAELFEQPGDSEASTPPSSTAEGAHAEEHVTKSADDEHDEYATKSDRPPALDEPADAFLERVREMMENFKKETS